MAQREGGYWMYLAIGFLILFVAAAVLFFDQQSQREQRDKEIEGLKNQVSREQESNRRLNQDINDLYALIGGTKYQAGETWPGNEYFKDLMKDNAERAVNVAMTDLGQARRTYTHLVEPYEDFPTLISQMIKTRDEAFQERATSNESLIAAKRQADASQEQMRGQLNAAQERVAELQRSNDDLDQQLKTSKAEWVAQIEELTDTMNEQVIQLNRRVNFLLSEKGSLQQRIEKLNEEVIKEKTFDDVEPDGELLELADSVGKGWINLGRVDHLRPGIVFRVFQPIKGGKKLLKGRVEVVRVNENMSEVRVVEEIDDLTPMTKGDLISSPFYDPKAQPVFVFATSELATDDYTKEYLEAKIASYGASVGEQVTLETDYLVATEGYELSDAYKAARGLNVTVIRERDLLEFIGR